MDLLIDKILKLNNPTVVGLDPIMDYIPNYIKEESFSKFGQNFDGASDAILTFNKGLIDSICDIVPAIKPQSAYYEMYSWQGVKALYETISYAKSKGMYVILDGKRNDIGSTMTAYSNAYLGNVKVGDNTLIPFGADSLTVNGYLGKDSIEPLLKDMKSFNKSIFVLVKTSNPSSGDLQDIKVDGKKISELMGSLCESWGSETTGKYGFTSVGAVVGATYPEMIGEFRQKLSKTFFLIPGYGAQGGTAKDIRNAFNGDGIGAIINSSRKIICAYKNYEDSEKHVFSIARDEAIKMKDDILSVI